MPRTAPKPCTFPGCPAITRGGRCERHQRRTEGDYDRKRGTAAQRGYDATWRRLRKMVLNRQPICQACGRRPATEVDHIIPKARGGDDSFENLAGLCRPCHSRKTAKEDGGWGRGGKILGG